MKLNILGVLVILTAATALGGGCTTNTSSNANTTNSSANTQAQPEIKISGSSSTYPAMKILADAYAVKVKNTKVSFLPPNQSEVAIAGVKEGVLEIATISKQLQPEDNDGTLEYRQVAKDALVVATHPSVEGLRNLTSDHLKAIYSGAIKNWQDLGGPDAKIVLLDRPEDESSKRLLRKHYLGKDLKNSLEAVILREEGDLITTVQNTRYSIGAFSLAYAISHQLPVNRLSLNGVEPTQENVKVGKYQMVRNISIISKKNSSKVVEGFMKFSLSEEGAETLRKSGFVPFIQK